VIRKAATMAQQERWIFERENLHHRSQDIINSHRGSLGVHLWNEHTGRPYMRSNQHLTEEEMANLKTGALLTRENGEAFYRKNLPERTLRAIEYTRRLYRIGVANEDGEVQGIRPREDWTPEEDEIIRWAAKIKRLERTKFEHTNLPCRGESGIYKRREQLKLTTPKASNWTPEEDALLRQAYSMNTVTGVSLRQRICLAGILRVNASDVLN
jgi:hypothetical protein